MINEKTKYLDRFIRAPIIYQDVIIDRPFYNKPLTPFKTLDAPDFPNDFYS